MCIWVIAGTASIQSHYFGATWPLLSVLPQATQPGRKRSVRTGCYFCMSVARIEQPGIVAHVSDHLSETPCVSLGGSLTSLRPCEQSHDAWEGCYDDPTGWEVGGGCDMECSRS